MGKSKTKHIDDAWGITTLMKLIIFSIFQSDFLNFENKGKDTRHSVLSQQ